MKIANGGRGGFGLKQNTTKALKWATKIFHFPDGAIRLFTEKDFSRTRLSTTDTGGYVDARGFLDLLDDGGDHRTRTRLGLNETLEFKP
jgi:hypothetical protein